MLASGHLDVGDREMLVNQAAPYQVWARALWAVLDLARLSGIRADGIFDGLTFDAVSVRSRRSVDWDEFCLLCERLESSCGGAEACQRLLATSYHEVLPELRSLVGGIVSPLTFARTVIEGVSPVVYQGCAFSLHELGEDRIRIELRLRPGARPSLTFFRATVGELAALPRHLGLPAAEVSADFSPTHGDYLVLLPASRSITDRALRVARNGVARVVLGLASDGQPITLTFGGSDRQSMRDRLRAATEAWQLTVRQLEVLEGVVEGASNKEIANALDCAENTVELHVTKLLRSARVSSRARLIAHFWSKL